MELPNTVTRQAYCLNGSPEYRYTTSLLPQWKSRIPLHDKPIASMEVPDTVTRVSLKRVRGRSEQPPPCSLLGERDNQSIVRSIKVMRANIAKNPHASCYAQHPNSKNLEYQVEASKENRKSQPRQIESRIPNLHLLFKTLEDCEEKHQS